MKILAFETSCDDTSVAIVENGRKILGHLTYSQNDHKKFGGVIPEIASRKHIEYIKYITEQLLLKTCINIKEIDAVAATCGPGLVGSLLIGLNFAKSISYAINKPFIPVNHIKGHIASNYLTYKNLIPPFLCLIISGGHTMIVNVINFTKMELISNTCDDAVGEVFDKFARVIGFGYPGGPFIQKYSLETNYKKFDLPNPTIKNRPLDFSFSWLKTFVLRLSEKIDKNNIEDINGICSSFSHKIAEILLKKTKLIANKYNINKIAIAGGVSCNNIIRKCFKKEFNNNVFMPLIELCNDNAAMIASQAYYEYISGNIGLYNQNAYSNIDINYVFNKKI